MEEMETQAVDNGEDLDLEEDAVQEDETLDETAAADTLNPAAAPGETKAQTLATFTQLLAQLGREDLCNLFDQVQSQFGPNKTPGAVDNSATNKATIKSADALPAAPALSVKEDVQEMFGSEDLSEEFKEKAEVVFEAALSTRLTLETARLEEEYAEKVTAMEEEYQEALEEQTSNIVEDLTDKLDQYIDYCVEQFMEENKIALETSLRAEIAENFISGLQNLFAEHYITVPEEKMDLVAELKSDLDEARATLNETLDEKIALQSIIEEATRNTIFDEVADGLAETQIEKLRTLTENVEFVDGDTFKKKVAIIKENYFSEKKGNSSTGLITEEIDGDHGEEEKAAYTAPGMDRYVDAIRKTAK